VPQIILMELHLPHRDDGLRLLPRLRQSVPAARVLALTALDPDAHLVHRAVRAGVVGYILKSTSDIDEVDLAIRTVARGQAYLSPAALVSLLATLSAENEPLTAQTRDGARELSAREQAVLELVAQGHTNRQIAVQLGITESTVRSHLHHILEKLQLANRVQVAAFVLRNRPPWSNPNGTGDV
jgi:DNA-binding NarL/FixJ family response regulator